MPMKKSLVVLALVAGCGASGERNASAPAPGVQTGTNQTVVAAPEAAGAGAGEGASLLGLWQSGGGKQPNQLCVVKHGDTPQFGLVVWGANMRSCSGAGTITRSGDRVSLTMTGDSACKIDARLERGKLVLPASLPQGCAYYCGANAKLENVAFTRIGSSPADVARAKDLAGDPLCG
jgi:hypothetical protein